MSQETDYVAIILFIVLVILIVSTLWVTRGGPPFRPTPMKTVHKMLTIANVGSEDVVYDLGCGDGRILVTAARKYGARAVGIENDPLRYIWCQVLITILGLRRRVKIKFGDFFSKDLSEATVVTCYLLQKTNTQLEEKFLKELNPSTRVVSYIFTFNRFLGVNRDGEVTLYHIPDE